MGVVGKIEMALAYVLGCLMVYLIALWIEGPDIAAWCFYGAAWVGPAILAYLTVKSFIGLAKKSKDNARLRRKVAEQDAEFDKWLTGWPSDE